MSVSAELVNDLVATIALYATTQVTFNLLTLDANIARRMYQSHTWKSKAIQESRGLIADDNVVAEAGWYAYYLIRNRTFYGRLDGNGPPITFIYQQWGTLWEQLPDYRVHLFTYKLMFQEHIDEYILFHRRLVNAYTELFVSEDGHLYSSGLLLIPKDNVYKAVDYDGYYFILTRDGVIVELTHHITNLPSVPGTPIDIYIDNNGLHIITSKGIDVAFDPIISSVTPVKTQKILAENITTELKLKNGETPKGLKVVKSIHLISDNPLQYVIDTTRSLVSVDSGKVASGNNIQTAISRRGGTVFTIVDA